MHLCGFWTYVFFISLVIKNSRLQEEMEIQKNSAYDDKDSCMLTVSEFYNEELKMIQLNISWLESYNFSFFQIVVSESENQKWCNFEFTSHLINLETDDNFLIIPHNHSPHDIKAGCSYSITTTDSTCNSNITLPDCVDRVCNCNKYFKKPHLEIKQLYSGYNLSWHLQNHTMRNASFRHVPNLINFTVLTANISKESYGNSQGYAILPPLQNNVSRQNVIIEASLTLENNCLVNDTITLEVVPKDDYHIIAAIVFSIVLILMIGCIMVVFIFIRSTFSKRVKCQIANNVMYVPYEVNMIAGEVKKETIRYIEEIDSGAFGVVYKGVVKDMNNIPGYKVVAIKQLKENASAEYIDDFLAEIKLMMKIGEHPNIVRFYGYCTRTQPYALIMEYVSRGSLKDYLVNLRGEWDKLKDDSVFASADCEYILGPQRRNSEDDEELVRESVTTQITNLSEEEGLLQEPKLQKYLDNKELRTFALQIAKGMAYLESIQITHRDLAARNILIDSNRNLKISDFGMSRKGPYVNTKHKLLPLRWMAIEAIQDRLTNTKSDVWSYGVVLWEIGTLGGSPYPDLPNNMILHMLLMGHRMERPEICTDQLYNLMLDCWKEDPEKRPSFEEIVGILDDKKEIYVDFNKLKHSYVFPPHKDVEK